MKKRRFALIITIVILLISLLFSGCTRKEPDKEEEVLLVQYYYDNICGSCEPEEEFITKFEELTGLSIKTQNLVIEMYNIYDNGSKLVWEDVAQQFDIPKEDHNFPILRINDDFKFLSEIDETLSDDFKSLIPPSDFIIKNNASVILYFSAPSCRDCTEAEENTLSKLPDEIIINGTLSPVQVFKISTTDSDGLSMLKTYFKNYYVSEENRQTPIVFFGFNYLSGPDEISKLPQMLEKGDGLDTPILELEAGQEESLLDNYGWLGVFATGLINGLNPCAISMVLMLLSLLIVDKKLIVPVGLSFVMGKFIGFLLIGTVLFSVIDKLPFDTIASVFKIVLLVLSAILILLNLNDLIAAKNEKYQKIKLQLPQSFRKKNHEWIKKLISVDKRWLIILGGVVLGLVLSAGEFLCTGQIYLAVIIQIVHSSSQLSGQALLYLVIYCIAFIIPLIIMVLFVSKGKRVFELSDKFRRNMTWVKLANMLIFILFFILVWFFF